MNELVLNVKGLVDRIVLYFGAVHTIIGDETQLNEANVIAEIKAIEQQLIAEIANLINDTLSTSTTRTYSIDKIKSLIEAAKVAITGNASANFDTLEKIEQEILALQQQLISVNDSINVLDATIGDPSFLQTANKSSLVSALNEVLGKVNAIIDDANQGNDTTYSSDKIVTLLNQFKDDLVNGAGSAYDTLLEIQQELQGNDTDIVTILGEQAKRVAVNITQAFTTAEKTTARANIGVYSTQQVDALISALQALADDLEDEQGERDDLTTDQKDTLVEAINWLHLRLVQIQNDIDNVADNLIDDAAGIGVIDKTYSVDKILSLIAALQAQITTNGASIGNVNNLNTSANDLVAAVNEVLTLVNASAVIDDANVTTTTTYSSDKIESLVLAVKTEILGGASGAYDTLLELQQAIESNDTDISQTLTDIANLTASTAQLASDRVAYDVNQIAATTAGEKAQARANIDVQSIAEVTAAIQAAKNDIIGGATAPYDTLGEIEVLLGGINTILASNDNSLDTLQEVVDFIKNNASAIATLQSGLSSITEADVELNQSYTSIGVNSSDSQEEFNQGIVDAVDQHTLDITALEIDKIDKTSIINDLVTGGTTNVLSAQQGVVLMGLINNINSLLSSDTSTLDSLQEVVDFIEANRDDLDNLTISNIAGLQTELTNLQNQINSLSSSLGNYYTKTEVDLFLAQKAPLNHTHDDRYYTEAESRDKFLATMERSGNDLRVKDDNGAVHSTVTFGNHAFDNGITTEFGAFDQTGKIVKVTITNGIVTAVTPSTTYGGSQDYIDGFAW